MPRLPSPLPLLLSLLPLLLAAPDARAFHALRLSSVACLDEAILSLCDRGPIVTGPGATASFAKDNPLGLAASVSGAISDYDHFTMAAHAAMDFNLGPAAAYIGQAHGSRGIVYVEFWDVLTMPGSGSGTVRMRWRLTGGVDVGFVGSTPVFSSFGIARLYVFFCSQAGSTPLGCTTQTLLWGTSQPIDEILILDAPIALGTPTQFNLEFQLSSSLGFQSKTCEESCVVAFAGHTDAVFPSSGDLLDAEILDGTGTGLDPSDLTSESGFAYHLVPEAQGLELAAAFALAAAARRRRAARTAAQGVKTSLTSQP